MKFIQLREIMSVSTRGTTLGRHCLLPWTHRQHMSPDESHQQKPRPRCAFMRDTTIIPDDVAGVSCATLQRPFQWWQHVLQAYRYAPAARSLQSNQSKPRASSPKLTTPSHSGAVSSRNEHASLEITDDRRPTVVSHVRRSSSVTRAAVADRARRPQSRAARCAVRTAVTPAGVKSMFSSRYVSVRPGSAAPSTQRRRSRQASLAGAPRRCRRFDTSSGEYRRSGLVGSGSQGHALMRGLTGSQQSLAYTSHSFSLHKPALRDNTPSPARIARGIALRWSQEHAIVPAVGLGCHCGGQSLTEPCAESRHQTGEALRRCGSSPHFLPVPRSAQTGECSTGAELMP